MLDNKTKLELNKLFLELIEGSISDSCLLMLDELLRKGPDVQAYYCQFMHTQVSMNKVFGSTTSDDSFAVFSETDTGNDVFDDLADATRIGSKVGDSSNVSLRGVDIEEFMSDVSEAGSDDSDITVAMLELLEMERTAPAVEIEKPVEVTPKPELIQKVERDFKWFPGEGNKALTRAYLALVASIVVFFGYVYFFVPEAVDRPVVAKLFDSIEAVWDDSFTQPDEFGEMVQSRYRLKKGFITILFNDGAKVTVESPAEMSLNSSGDMELFSGRIYAVVPQRAHGFTVKAASSKIVDMGTEFGVEVDKTGSTQLHVTRGRTILFPGLFKESREQIEVTQGSAKKVYNDGFVNDIKLEDSKFVRHIDSKNNRVVRDSLVEVFYEPFDYAGGFLEDVSDWVKVDGALPDRGILVESTGLAYGTLPSRGGRINSGTRFDRTRGYTLNNAATAIADAGLLADGQTLWFSVMVETLVSENTSLVVALGTDYVNGYYQIDGGSGDSVGFDMTNGNDFQSRYFIGGTAVKSGLDKKNVPNGKPIMLVIEMIWNADNALPDTLNYYLPDDGLNIGSPVATLNTAAFNQAAFDTFSVSVCGKIALDEIRFGKSYSDVVGGR
ncbi:MAG: FecR family protein [Phycisphaerae bacterium]|nr:FecR family protein [Phycisphaerae bacterium]